MSTTITDKRREYMAAHPGTSDLDDGAIVEALALFRDLTDEHFEQAVRTIWPAEEKAWERLGAKLIDSVLMHQHAFSTLVHSVDAAADATRKLAAALSPFTAEAEQPSMPSLGFELPATWGLL
jgi:hypothetical protein